MRKCGRWSVTSSGWKAVYRRKLKLPSTPPTDGGVHIVAAWRRAQIAVLGQFPSSALFGKCIECGLGGSRRARALIGAGVRSREHAFGERNRRHRRPAGSGVHTLRSAVCNSRSHLDCLEAAPERFPLFATAARPRGSASMATPLDGMICMYPNGRRSVQSCREQPGRGQSPSRA